jgi:hypothetical protein
MGKKAYKLEENMVRIYVNITKDEIELVEGIRNKFKEKNGFRPSRQNMLRSLLMGAIHAPTEQKVAETVEKELKKT